ncbi:MAG: WXG100 family type VII secretion target [Mycobacterium sp.]|nr:WXG100 family type VII secretion target [Mycobacterium sp.]
MEASAKHVEDVNGQLGAELSMVRNLVEGARENWEGAAHGSFQRVMGDYDGASKRLHDVLAEIATLIRENGRGYDQSEREHEDSINRAGASGELGSSLKI